MSALAENIKSKKITSFIILTYAISLLIWLPGILLNWETRSVWTMLPIGLGAWGPCLAAMIMVRASEGKGAIRRYWRRILRVRTSFLWYLAAVGIPLISSIPLHYVVYLLLGGNSIPVSTLLEEIAKNAVPFIPILLLMIVIGGGQEELGWRGYLQGETLKRTNPFLVSVFIGIIWAVWHLPMWLYKPSGQYGMNFGLFTIMVIAFAIQQTWLYAKTKGIIITAVLMHATSNASQFIYNALDTSVKPQVISCISLWIIAGVLVLTMPRYFFRKQKLS